MKKIFMLLILTTLAFLTTGCWGNMDLNRLSTATAIGIDKAPQGYLVTIQAINSSSQTQIMSNRSPIVVYSEEGHTVFEALRKLTFKFPSRVLMSHFRLLVFGEDYAREGTREILGWLYNDAETRQKYNLLVVKGKKAQDFLKVITPLNPDPAEEVNYSIMAAKDFYGSTHMIYADEFLALTECKLNNPVVTSVEIQGDIKKGSTIKNVQDSSLKAKLVTKSLSVFKDDKLVGFLTVDESQGYTYLMGEVESSVLPVNYGKNKKVTVEIAGTHDKRAFKLVNNVPTVYITISVKGYIAGLESGFANLKIKEVKEIQKVASKNIMQKIQAAIEKSQKVYNADIFRIASLIHQKKPSYFHKIENKYDKVYQTIDFKVKVKTEIINTPL